MTTGPTQSNNSSISPSCCWGLNEIAHECPGKIVKWYTNVAYDYDYIIAGFTSEFDKQS